MAESLGSLVLVRRNLARRTAVNCIRHRLENIRQISGEVGATEMVGLAIVIIASAVGAVDGDPVAKAREIGASDATRFLLFLLHTKFFFPRIDRSTFLVPASSGHSPG
jgi:hypothetical protein